MKVFANLADLPEDTRIDISGKTASEGALIGFVVDDDEKADRYIMKLRERFNVRIVDRMAGPVTNTVLVRVGPIVN